MLIVWCMLCYAICEIDYVCYVLIDLLVFGYESFINIVIIEDLLSISWHLFICLFLMHCTVTGGVIDRLVRM